MSYLEKRSTYRVSSSVLRAGGLDEKMVWRAAEDIEHATHGILQPPLKPPVHSHACMQTPRLQLHWRRVWDGL